MSQTASSPTDAGFEHQATLVAALREGRRDAFRYAVSRYSGQMLAAARSIVGPHHAEDIVQDAWLAAFRQIDNFEQRAALGTWLQRIVTNRAISHLRAHAREVSMPDNDDSNDDWFDAAGHWAVPPQRWNAASPDELLSAADLQDCIDKHLQLMPDAQREVVVLRDMQDAEFTEICSTLTLSSANARVLLHRARIRLMKMIDRFQESGTC